MKVLTEKENKKINDRKCAEYLLVSDICVLSLSLGNNVLLDIVNTPGLEAYCGMPSAFCVYINYKHNNNKQL